MKTNSGAIIVPPPAAAGARGTETNDIRPIRPPVEVPSGWAWLGWTFLALAVLAAAAWAWRRRRGQRNVAPPVVIVPPHIRARHRLEEALRYVSEPKIFCTKVSDAARLYLEERFQFHAPERTTEEFLVELQSSNLLLPDQKASLAAFLESCDMVKFAGFEPTELVLRDLHAAASRLVEETHVEAFAVAPGGAASSPPPDPATPAS